MSKVANVVDSFSHNASLMKELAGKGSAEKAEIMIRENTGKVTEFLSKEVSDAMRASVTSQMRHRSCTTNSMDLFPFYKAIIHLRGGSLPEPEDIELAFEIINKKAFPEKNKAQAIQFLSDLAPKMKEIEQNLLEDAKKHSFYEELLQALRKDMAKYKEQAEKMVKSGELESNPFI